MASSDDIRVADKDINTCFYTVNSSDVFVCTRWLGLKQKVHYAFIGDRVDINRLQILSDIENEAKIDAKDKEYIENTLGFSYDKYKPIRFIRRTIFEDDTRISLLQKVVRFIQEYYRNNNGRFDRSEYITPLNARFETRKDLPITWRYKKAWLFDTDATWSDWKANPWKLQSMANIENTLSRLTRAPNHTSIADELSISKDGIQLTYVEDIPTVRSSDILRRWYSLWNDETPLPSWDQLNMEEYTLREIWNYPSMEANTVKIDSCNLDEYIESGNSLSKSTFMEIFDTVPLSTNVPLVQWIGDKYHIVYRLYKKHTLSEELLNKFTDTTKSVGDSSLTIIVNIPKSNAYIRFVFDDTGKYFIHAKLTGNMISMKDVNMYIKDYKNVLHRLYGVRFNSDDRSIRGKTVLQLQKSIKTALLFQELTKYGWLFSVQEGDARYQRLKLSFLRSANALHRMNEEEFIRSQLLFIENREELLEKLQQVFGITQQKARSMLEDYEQTGTSNTIVQESASKEKRWVHIPATVFVSKIGDSTLQIQSENFPNMEDMYRMIHWLQGIITKILLVNAESEITGVASFKPIEPAKEIVEKKKFVEIPKDIVIEPSPISSYDKSSISRSSSSSLQSSSKSSSLSARSASSTLGGASGTGYDIIGKLKNADAVLFTKTMIPNSDSKYPRLCNANTNQQPIVVTQDEMARIDNSEYKNSYDNKMLYGSDKDPYKHHYYMCPRIWCPTSKVPLTPEQLDKLGGKCPAPHQEEPWLLYNADYWGRDPSKKHFIGFHKKQGSNGLCLPCCKRLEKVKMDQDPMWDKCTRHIKKDGKDVKEQPSTSMAVNKIEKETSETAPKKRGRKAKQVEDKEDYYLLRYNAPIDPKRWGIIPEKLHQLLQPTKPYTQCYTQVKSDSPCLVRKGIYHHGDSLLNALGYLLTSGNGGKREFLKMLREVLTPLHFISLENGTLLTSLSDKEAIIPSKNQRIILDWKEWVQKYSEYVDIFGLKELISKCAFPLEMSIQNQLKLSRELMVYIAWKRFWEYMESTEVKDLVLVYDLVQLLGARIIIWEKISEEEVYLRCPLPTSFDDIYDALYDNRIPYVMLMYENDHYEPIELKSRGTYGVTLLDDSELINRLKQMEGSCGRDVNTTSRYTNILSLILLRTLPATAFDDTSIFDIHSIFITSKLTIGGFVLKSGIQIRVPIPIPMHHIQKVMKVLGVKHIVYEEDIRPRKFTIFVPSSYLSTYMKLLQHLRLSWNVVSIKPNEDTVGLYTIQVDVKPKLELAIIPTNTMNLIEDRRIVIESDQNHWIKLERIIGNKIYKNYANWVTPNIKKDTSELVDEIASKFSYIPYQKKVRAIIEEIPLHSQHALQSWILRIGASNKYPFYTDKVHTHKKKEWVFSQLAIGGALPQLVIKPQRISNPPDLLLEKVSSSMRSISIHAKRKVHIPFMENTSLKALPSKWTTLKQFKLDDLKIASYGDDYQPKKLWDTLRWISNQMQIDVPIEIIQYVHQTHVVKMISDENSKLLEEYVSDPAIWKALAKRMDLEKSKSSTVIKKYLQLEKQKQVELWLDYYTSDEMVPCDLDIWIYSQLINVAFLLLHKSPSGTGVEVSERNKLEDFLTSVTLLYDLKNNSTRKKLDELPLIALYKTSKTDASFTRYEVLVYKETQYMFEKVKEAPKTVSILVHEVAKLQKL